MAPGREGREERVTKKTLAKELAAWREKENGLKKMKGWKRERMTEVKESRKKETEITGRKHKVGKKKTNETDTRRRGANDSSTERTFISRCSTDFSHICWS